MEESRAGVVAGAVVGVEVGVEVGVVAGVAADVAVGVAAPGSRDAAATVMGVICDPVCLQVLGAAAGADGVREGDVRERVAAPPARVTDAVRRLVAVGLLVRGPGDDPYLTAQMSVLRRAREVLLQPAWLTAFLDAEPQLSGTVAGGRIATMPMNPELRSALARLIAGTIPWRGKAMSESELGTHLAVFGPDVAELRRLLADEGLVRRDPSRGMYSPGA